MFDASTLEVFIASTNDLQEERNAVEEVLREWNSHCSRDRQIMLKSIRWEKDVTPELGPGSFQAVINKQLLEPADILIGVIGKRLGSPTETAIAGTVEEIERFAAAEKPVLLYFSDRQFSLSDIDLKELERVREFRQSMQKRGLYATFKDIADLKQQIRSHLESRLADFEALLIPAGRALAYGYFKNFVEPTHRILRGRQVNLPDYKIGGTPNQGAEDDDGPSLSFSSFRIRIARPVSLEHATDEAVFNLRKDWLAEINLKLAAQRRAFRVYLPKAIKARLEKAVSESAGREKRRMPVQRLKLESLDVIDFPTPLIALQVFIRDEEPARLKGKSDRSALGYWKKQKVTQYEEFFERLEKDIKKEGISSVSYFDFVSGSGFRLPD